MTLLGRTPSIITVANDKVPITVACRFVGVQVNDDSAYGESIKVHCPWGLFHSDRGQAPAMRVYLTSNHAWCFACSAHYTPVKLVAQHRDVDWNTAATILLDHIGHKPISLADQWQELITHEPAPDTALLADALKTYCQRVIPGWESRQFNRDEAAMLTRCLTLLDRVSTEADAQRWLAATKAVMVTRFSTTHSLTIQ